MNCPTCSTVDLVMTERQGVEIDYCPKCRGVWLDRGELDKIIEKSTQPANYPPPEDREYGRRHGGHSERHSSHGSSGHGSSGHGSSGHGSSGHGSSGHGSSGQGSSGHGSPGYGSPGYRRKSWLSDIFD